MSSNYLFELGTEELPPKALKTLSDSLTNSVKSALTDLQLQYTSIQAFATPRRLALLARGLDDQTPTEQAVVWGPPAKIAFDGDGQPTKAALAFCSRNNIDSSEITVKSDGKVDKVCCQVTKGGESTASLLPGLVESALAKLPIPKRMRWGASRTEFVRPVHWLVFMQDDTVIEATVLGLTSGRETRGHRFLGQSNITLATAAEYETTLKEKGKVICCFDTRRALINNQVEKAAGIIGGSAVVDSNLLDEVCGLVEWPVAVSGKFDKNFLSVPSEALISSMKEHQKYFHVVDKKGSLLPHFITVSNIETDDYSNIISGNERVIRPRLADAAFFFDTDKKVGLAARRDKLKTVVFQAKLGSIYDKTERIKHLAASTAQSLGFDTKDISRAAELSKSDLVSSMVSEFPEMQGIAGYHYAVNDNESDTVARAIADHYLPKFSGDAIPASETGAMVALADRLDTITGIFGIGQIPTGSKDPFALRRASLAVLRIIIEGKYDVNLRTLVANAVSQHEVIADPAASTNKALDYILERLRSIYEDQGISAEVFRSVISLKPSAPLDIDQRIKAVHAFSSRTEASSLAAANKRVANILTKQTDIAGSKINPSLLSQPEEVALAAALDDAGKSVSPLCETRQYEAALTQLATLQAPVDEFFDNVLVNADDLAVRQNRLALLTQLRNLFMQIADISHLVPAKT